MFNITHDKVSNILAVKDSEENVFGKIYLNDGASLQELTLNKHAIIQDLAPLTYGSTYASSILFPFANRVKNGAYTYEGQDFQLKMNAKVENNAIHGFVYNKVFKVIKQKTNDDTASILLEYNEEKQSQGFPYTYKIQLKYNFTKAGLSLSVMVLNTSAKAFPFTLGWHPYFVSDNLYESTLNFDSNKKLILDKRNITTGIDTIKPINSFKIAGQQLDDCWILNSDKIIFHTPKYDLTFNASSEKNFLQAYTPDKPNTMAIEPTTGVSDSLNNKIGLQILKPNASYEVTWELNIN